jgi:light-regulated signal transduction histidine kinase (bacteriophytochrome)
MDKETWSNIGKGDVFILTYDHKGALRSVPIRAGQSLTISVEERQLNQDRAASADMDIFSNGRLAPMRLVDSADDYEEIASNPNHLTETDMLDILKTKGKTFSQKLDDITNVIALERMHELASDESLNVSMAQFRALESRLAEVRGDVAEVSEVEVIKP